MFRTVVVALAWFVGGAGLYWYASGASTTIRIATVVTELALCAVVTLFLLLHRVRVSVRVPAALAAVTTVSLASTWIETKLIAAMSGGDAVFYAMGVVGRFVQAIGFAALVWVTTLAVGRLGKQEENGSASAGVDDVK